MISDNTSRGCEPIGPIRWCLVHNISPRTQIYHFFKGAHVVFRPLGPKILCAPLCRSMRLVEQKQIVIIQKGMEQNTMDVCVSIRIPALMSGIKVAAEHNIWTSCNK